MRYKGGKVKCLFCKEIIKDLYPESCDVIKMELSHNLDGMWDDMESKFFCGWKCYHKLMDKYLVDEEDEGEGVK